MVSSGSEFASTLDYRVTEDNATLSLVSAMLEKFNAELTNFQPTLAVIATFFFVPVSNITHS